MTATLEAFDPEGGTDPGVTPSVLVTTNYGEGYYLDAGLRGI